MEPPSLHNSSILNAANYIVKGFYQKVPIQLPKKESNIIFQLVDNRRRNLSEEERKQVDETLQKMDNITIMYFTGSTDYESNIQLVKDKKIEELGLPIIKQNRNSETETVSPPSKKRKTDEASEIVNIVALLANNLTAESQQHLKKLDLSNPPFTTPPRYFAHDWVTKMARLLPSLTHLKFSKQHWIIENQKFREICKCFPQLVCLDITDTWVHSLEGISKLSHLQELSIGSFFLREIEEMFELQHLKILNMKGKEEDVLPTILKTLEFFVNCETSLVALEEFNCSRNLINNQDLKKIEKRHPTLKTIIAINTSLNEYKPESLDVKIITDDTVASCSQAIEYFSKLPEHNEEVNKLMLKMVENLENARGQPRKEELQNFIGTLHQLVERYRRDSQKIDIIGRFFYFLIFRVQQVLDNEYKQILMESLIRLIKLKLFKERSDVGNKWFMVNVLLRATENPPIDRIASAAFEIFLLAEDDNLKTKSMSTASSLVDKIDLASACYETIDRSKLLYELKEFQKNSSVQIVVPDFEKIIECFETYNSK